MAKCEACGGEMLTADGCTFNYIKTSDGKYYKRYKVGDEGWYDIGERCGDCGALYGHYHHPGCDVERCPICGDQLFICDCDIETYVVAREQRPTQAQSKA